MELAPENVPILFAKTLPVFLRKLEHNEKYLTTQELDWVSEEILKQHRPFLPFPLSNRWHFQLSDLHSSVKCQECWHFGMSRLYSGWKCDHCNHRDWFAHEQAIKDWFMLISDTMTNKRCRDFLGIESRHLAKRLLQ